MTDEERALLAAVIASPDDDTPRLVYADWLDEHGRPERAEFIRVQVELTRLVLRDVGTEKRYEELSRREQDLLQTRARDWERDFVRTVPQNRQTRFWYRRGMIGEVWCTPKYFREAAEALVSAAPIQEVYLRRPTAGPVKTATGVPSFRRVRTLRLDADELTPGVMQAVLGGPIEHLRGLMLTSYTGHAEPPPGWAARSASVVGLIASCPRLGGLEYLNFKLAGIGDEGGLALAKSEHLKALRVLLLTGNPLSESVRDRLRQRFGDAVYFDYSDYRGRLAVGHIR